MTKLFCSICIAALLFLNVSVQAQIPLISSFSPAKGKAGSTVIINGSNFNSTMSNNTVRFGNGIKGIVTNASATQLSVTVPATVSGYVTVLNTATGLAAKSPVEFKVTSSQLTSVPFSLFEPGVSFPATGAFNIQLADLNDDGKTDVISAVAGGLVFYKNIAGQGAISSNSLAAKISFGPADNYSSSPLIKGRNLVNAIQFTDINGDGKQDILVTTPYYTKILLNDVVNGQITASSFGTRVNLSKNFFVRDIADFDKDGKPDLVVARRDSVFDTWSNSYIYYEGKECIMRNTTPAGSQTPSFVEGANMPDVVYEIADLNGDGLPDYMTEGIDAVKNISTPGNIQFAVKVPVTSRTNGGFVVKDIDGDGKPDILKNLYDYIHIFRNISATGSIAFAPQVKITYKVPPVNAHSTVYDVQDITGDGKPDFLLQHRVDLGTTHAELSILVNTLTPGNITQQGFSIQFVIDNDINAGNYVSDFADFDGDSKIDLFIIKPNGFDVIKQNANQIAPVVTAAMPMRAIPGELITITGTNFNPDAGSNSINFGGVKVPAQSADKFTIKVKAPVGSSYQSISVTNLKTGLSSATAQNFTPMFLSTNNGLALPVNYTAWMPAGAVLADIDGDGKVDMVVASSGNNIVVVYRNTSVSGEINASSFASGMSFFTAEFPVSVVVKDVTGDGKPDIVAANYRAGNVSVLRNTSVPGSITENSFTGKLNLTTGQYPSSVAVGDFDNDGKPDIVVSNSGGNTISVFKNTLTAGKVNTGSFAAAVTISVGQNPAGVAVADIDGDARPEIIVANYAHNNISVLRNIATQGELTTASFAAAIKFATGVNPQSLTTGDIDGDGKNDIITANKGSNTVSVFRNNSSSGSITLSPKVDMPANGAPVAVALGDITGDGKPEILIANSTGNTLSQYINQSIAGKIAANSFGMRADIATGREPFGIATGDMDGDGKSDVLVTNLDGYSISAYRNTSENEAPDGTPAVVIDSFTPQTAPIGATITITGKNFGTSPEKNIVYFGSTRAKVNSAMPTELIVEAPAGATYKPISVLNTASKLNGYATIPFSNTFPSKEAIGQADFSPEVKMTGNYRSNIAIADIDGDGKSDLVTVYIQSISLYRNISATGTLDASSFAPKVDIIPVTYNNSFGGIIITDMDSDGKPDLVFTDNNTIKIYKNTSLKGVLDKSSFVEAASYPMGEHISRYTVADMDLDGKPDIVVGRQSPTILRTDIFFLQNVGKAGIITAASFKRVPFTLIEPLSTSIVFDDFNTDGVIDIAVQSENTLHIYQNNVRAGNSSQPFKKFIYPLPGLQSGYLYSGNVVGNNKPDLVIVHPYKKSLIILPNRSTAAGDLSTSAFVLSGGSSISFPGDYEFTALAIADMNGDGKIDMLLNTNGYNGVTKKYSGTIHILRSTGDVSPFFVKTELTTSGFYAIRVGDLDGDGKPDIAATGEQAPNVVLLKNILTEEAPVGAINMIAGVTDKTAKKSYSLSMYPNPTNAAIGFALDNYKGEHVNVLLTNLNGKTVHAENFKTSAGNTYYKLNLAKKPEQGIYILKVSGNGLNESSKIIVE